MNRDISVALCTCDGARHLGAQLDSLARQTRLPDELVALDDNSSDESVRILEDFAARAPFPVTIRVNENRLGPAANFAAAAALCKGDIVFFCDQDDVWREEKIAILSSALRQAELKYGTDTPILVHSDLEIVDEELSPVHPSFFGLMKFGTEDQDIADLLNRNVVTGCATAVNRPLLDLALPMPRAALMHDGWFALCARAQGAILSIDTALVRYRQHGANQVGARAFTGLLADACRAPLRHWWRSLDNFRASIAQAKALAARMAGKDSAETESAHAVAAYASIMDIPKWKRPMLVWKWNFGRHSRAGVSWFLLKAIFA